MILCNIPKKIDWHAYKCIYIFVGNIIKIKIKI